jgi:hypothetical protein
MFRPILVFMTATLAALAAVSVGMAASTNSAANKPTAVCQHGGYVDLFPQVWTCFSRRGHIGRNLRSSNRTGSAAVGYSATGESTPHGAGMAICSVRLAHAFGVAY